MTIRVSNSPEDFATLSLLKGATTVIFRDPEDNRVFTRLNEKGLTYTEITSLYKSSIAAFALERVKELKARMYVVEATALVSEDILVIGNFMLLVGGVNKAAAASAAADSKPNS